jgi:hypothetical protein
MCRLENEDLVIGFSGTTHAKDQVRIAENAILID